ncbi:MAG: alkaline phosphatase family protein [Acidobacteriota bacterium]
MRRRTLLPLLAALSLPAFSQTPAAPAKTAPAATRKPKLVLMIVVDQFRADYLWRFREQYNGGLDRLMRQGAHFVNAYYEHFPTVTAVGHSTILSGATPSLSGIVGNDWYDRASGKNITSVVDPTMKLLGAPGEASSPHRLLVSTLGDEMKSNGRGKPKTIGISIKDRSAILPVGRSADGAFWFDNKTGNFVSSTWYFPELPKWAADFNASRAVDHYLKQSWVSIENSKAAPFVSMGAEPVEKYYAQMQRTPFGNEILELLAEKAIEGEQLGQRGDTDLLSVSFSSNDYVGHEVGPDDPKVRDISIRTDRTLAKLFAFLDKKIGMANVLIAFTADHGVSPTAEMQATRHMPGGRLSEPQMATTVETALAARYGGNKWVIGRSGPTMYLNYDLMRQMKLDPHEVRNVAAEALRAFPHIARVYTRDDLLTMAPRDFVDRRVRVGFHEGRGGDIYPVSEPNYTYGKDGASHGSPYNYDAHVPVILMGPGVKPGRYTKHAAVNDIAPTLATILDVEVPSGSVGRALDEALAAR